MCSDTGKERKGLRQTQMNMRNIVLTDEGVAQKSNPSFLY